MNSPPSFVHCTPPTSPTSMKSHETTTRIDDLRTCAQAAFEQPSHESTVQHLSHAFGGQVDVCILDCLVSTARQSGPGLENQVDALVQNAVRNGVDGSFLSPSQREKEQGQRIPKVPQIENMELIGMMRMIARLPSNQVVDELCRRIGRDIDRCTIAPVFAWVVEQTSDVEEQALLLAKRMQEMGLENFFELTDQDKFDCPVCSDTFSKLQGFEFHGGVDQDNNNGHPHMLCFTCALGFVRAAIESGDPNLHCFQCQHPILPHEVARILGQGNQDTGRNHPLYRELDILKRDFAIGKDPAEYASCPSPNCNWIVARSARGAAEKADCPLCGFRFCTNCLAPYHYRTTCAERRQLLDAWRDWPVTGRVQYWQKDEERRRKAASTARAEKKRIESVIRIEQQDEQWKAENCRHCPHCNRLVNRFAGCSVMRCGYDTDSGANVQNGCMQRFDWNAAAPYQPQAAGSRVQYPTQASAKTRHEYWQCSACAETVVGLRFECVNCASFTLCEECEQDYCHAHADGAHFFRIHERADT